MGDIITKSPAETARVGEILGRLLGPGDVICLLGDLGAGKTCLTQGLAKNLGVEEHVTSPTFTLINEHHGRLPLYHMDVYRLEGASDMEDLGYEEYFYGDGVTVVEWADRVDAVLPAERLEIILMPDNHDERLRQLVLRPMGERYEKMAEVLVSLVRAGN